MRPAAVCGPFHSSRFLSLRCRLVQDLLNEKIFQTTPALLVRVMLKSQLAVLLLDLLHGHAMLRARVDSAMQQGASTEAASLTSSKSYKFSPLEHIQLGS